MASIGKELRKRAARYRALTGLASFAGIEHRRGERALYRFAGREPFTRGEDALAYMRSLLSSGKGAAPGPGSEGGGPGASTSRTGDPG